jgi:hypothetical protein
MPVKRLQRPIIKPKRMRRGKLARCGNFKRHDGGRLSI